MRRIKARILKVFSEERILPYFFLFLCAFSLFYYLHSALTFPDPDSFYHAKMAVLTTRGPVREFPWLPYTILQNNFADHHFLYHVAMIPFVNVLDPLVGTKLATITFAALMITVFYWFLKKNEVSVAWLYTLVLMVSASFIFRLNLAKAQALALIFFFLGLVVINQRKYFLMFVISFFYVWLYGGWPLMLVAALVFVAADIIRGMSASHRFAIEHRWLKKILSLAFHFEERAWRRSIASYFKILFSVGAGLTLGLIINPYFPQNLLFYYNQIIQVAIINYRSIIGVGGEWYPYSPPELVASASIAFIFFVVGITFFILNFRKQNTLSIALGILSFMFFFLTVKSRRNVEYLIPVMLAFAATSITRFGQAVKFSNFYDEIITFIRKEKVLMMGVLVLAFALPAIAVRDVIHTHNVMSSGFTFNKFVPSLTWLKENAEPGSVIFHSDWDEFPILFYQDSTHRYIAGLDPTFLYRQNPELFWKWDGVTRGNEIESLREIVADDFHAQYVFIDYHRHENMDKNFQDNFLFEKVYADQEARIYRVK